MAQQSPYFGTLVPEVFFHCKENIKQQTKKWFALRLSPFHGSSLRKPLASRVIFWQFLHLIWTQKHGIERVNSGRHKSQQLYISYTPGELYDFPEDIEECFHQGLLSKLSTSNGKPEHGVAPTSTRKLLSQKQQQQQDREETEDVYRQSRGKHFQCHSNMINKGQTKRSAKQTDHSKKKMRMDAFVPETPCISIKDSNYPEKSDSRQIKYPFSVPETPLLHGVNSEQEYLNLQGVKTAVPVHYRELGPNQKIFTVPETPLVQQCTMQESPLLGGSDMNFPEDIYALQWPWNKQHAQVVPETPILQ